MSGEYAEKSWIEIEHEGEFVKTTLVVETDLELDATKPGYDEEQVNKLVASVVEELKERKATVDRARIVPRR